MSQHKPQPVNSQAESREDDGDPHLDQILKTETTRVAGACGVRNVRQNEVGIGPVDQLRP